MDKTMGVLLAVAAGVLCGCPMSREAGLDGPGEPGPAERGFSVGIEQEGRPVTIADHAARLRKRPFTIVLSFPGVHKIMVNASFRADLAEAVRAGRPVASVLPLPRAGFQEDLFNPKKMVFVADDGYNYWYYGNPEVHKYDRALRENGRFTCRRLVANYSTGSAAPVASIARLAGDVLYLTFVEVDWNTARTARVEKQAEYLKLTFE